MSYCATGQLQWFGEIATLATIKKMGRSWRKLP